MRRACTAFHSKLAGAKGRAPSGLPSTHPFATARQISFLSKSALPVITPLHPHLLNQQRCCSSKHDSSDDDLASMTPLMRVSSLSDPASMHLDSPEGLAQERLPEPDGDDPDQLAAEMIRRNEIWHKHMMEANPDYFSQTGGKQAPRCLWIGCSDSRVPAEQIVPVPPGNLFVHRNIANTVMTTDLSSMSVVQFAVDYLKVQDIVVCGHYDCGGLRAALSNVDHSAPLESWLSNIRDVVRLHLDQLTALPDEERLEALVKLHVQEQCMNLMKTSVVQRARAKAYSEKGAQYPRVHGMVYNPSLGKLERIRFNMRALAQRYASVYELGYFNEPSPIL